MRLSLSSVFQDDSAFHVGGSVGDELDHHQRRAALNIRRIHDAGLELVDSRQELADLQAELEIEADVGVGNAPVAREGVAALARQALVGLIQAAPAVVGAGGALAHGHTAVSLHDVAALATQAVVTGQAGLAFAGTSRAVALADDEEALSTLEAGSCTRASLAVAWAGQAAEDLEVEPSRAFRAAGSAITGGVRVALAILERVSPVAGRADAAGAFEAGEWAGLDAVLVVAADVALHAG